MAQQLAVRGTKLLIEVETAPGVFEHPCFINTDRAINFQADTVDSPTYDCDDPDASGWKQREKTDLSADITGSGRLYTADVPFWDAWFRSLDPKNVKIVIDADAAQGGGSWTGAYQLQQLQLSGGGKGTTMETTVALLSTGEVGAFVPAV